MSNIGAGLTVEDVDAIQDEMNKIGEDDGSDAAAAEAAEAAKLAETAAADKAKADADAAEAAKSDKTKADEAAAAADKNKADDTGKEDTAETYRELREQNKVLQASLSKAVSDYQKLHKVLLDKGVITEEEAKLDKEQEEKVQAAYTERQNKLNEMVAIMELNPTFTDVRQVCTQGNLDDIVDAFSKFYVKENGGDAKEIAARMEQEIWNEVNPYKRIYELVKTYHPKYAKKEELAKADDKGKAPEKKADAKDINPSAATLGASGGGSGAGNGGWTAAKIDALDEDELSTVPKDIYEKYLANQLN
jgi:hypothetical protein